MQRVFLAALLAAAASHSNALDVIEPSVKTPTSFAIIVDKASFDKVSESLLTYRQSIEEDGLGTYVAVDDWERPEYIRDLLFKWYNNREQPLEGAVLVGDIPIARVRDAQYLTSAFKMDQNRDWKESSVASDRFYDDFDLRFDFLRQDDDNPLFYYYSLSADSKPYLAPEIYTARIKPNQVDSIDKYELLANYLKKAARVKREEKNNAVDHLSVARGHAYNSDDRLSWAGEQQALREQLPQAFMPGGMVKFLDYDMQPFVKDLFLDAVSDPQLDIILFHHHGGHDRQYLSASDNDSIPEALLEIRTSDVREANPNARFVYFDACYNGSFYEDDYLAGAYIFGSGNTVVTIGSTVNSLQDKWPDEFLGLLDAGMRVGQLNRHAGYLESHVLGDPTFHFQPNRKIDFDINDALSLHQGDTAFWLSQLNSLIPDVVAMSLRQLWLARYENASSLFAECYRFSSDFVVRMEAVKLLALHYPEQSVEVLQQSLNDSYELIRRLSVIYAERNASPLLVPYIVKTLLARGHERRLSFQLNNNLTAFDAQELDKALKTQLASGVRCKGQEIDEFREQLAEYKEWLAETKKSVEDTTQNLERRISAVKSFRNYPNAQMIESLLAIASDEKEPLDLRFYAIHSLGWFDTHYRRKEIVDGLRTIKTSDKILTDEIVRSLSRLE